MKTKKIFSKLIAMVLSVVLVVGLLPMTAFAVESEYSRGDIAIINKMITNNGLKLPLSDGTNVPDEWMAINPNSQHLDSYTTWIWDGESTYYIRYINVYGCGLTGSLNLSGLNRLSLLDCSRNSLTELNVSGLTNLLSLRCWDNELISLEAPGLSKLNYIDFSDNYKLESLDLSGASSLTALRVYNELTDLNVSGMMSLKEFRCSYTLLTSLDLSELESLENVDCADNEKLTSLNVSDCPSLTYLQCWNNNLSNLNVSGSTSLEYLGCSGNNLTSLNLSGLTSLEELECSYNRLSSLNVTGLTSLTGLWCDNNNLTSLNVSGLPNLDFADCRYNYIAPNNLMGYNDKWDNLEPWGYARFQYTPQKSEDDKFQLIVTAGEGGSVSGNPDGKYKEGDLIRLSATIEDEEVYRFDRWDISEGVMLLPETLKNKNIEFLMPANNVIANAVFKKLPKLTITEVEGIRYSLMAGDALGYELYYPGSSGYYPPGTEIRCYVTAEQGYRFNGWTGNGVDFNTSTMIIDEVRYNTVYFTMPDNDVTVTPVAIRDEYYFSCQALSNGKIDPNGTPGGYIPAGTLITQTAIPNLDYEFDKWTVSDVAGNPLKNADGNPITLLSEAQTGSSTIFFEMPEADVYLYANFKVTDIPLELEISVNPGTMKWGRYVKEHDWLDVALIILKKIPNPAAPAIHVMDLMSNTLEQIEMVYYLQHIWSNSLNLNARIKNSNQTARYEGTLTITLPQDMCFSKGEVRAWNPNYTVSPNGKTLTVPVPEIGLTNGAWVSLLSGITIHPTIDSFNYVEGVTDNGIIQASLTYNGLQEEKTINANNRVGIEKEYASELKPPDARSLYIQCPVDVLILNSSGELLAQVANYDDAVICIDGLVAYAVGETKYVSIPHDKLSDFQVKLEAADNGTMSLLSFDVTNGNINNLTTFIDVPLTKSEVYNTDITSEALSLFSANGGNPMEPDSFIKIENDSEGRQIVSIQYIENGETKTDSFILGDETLPVVLLDVIIDTMPIKTVYTEGEPLDLSGMVITAAYSDDSTKTVTGYTTDPVDGATLNSVGPQTVTVSYTEGGITKTACFTVMVNALPPIEPGNSDAEFLQAMSAEILRNGLGQNNLLLNGKTLILVIDGREFVLSTNANNRNISGEIALGDGYYLVFDIKGNGSNVKDFRIIKR